MCLDYNGPLLQNDEAGRVKIKIGRFGVHSEYFVRGRFLLLVIMIVIIICSLIITYCSVHKHIKFLNTELRQKSLELTLRVKRYEFIPYSLATNEHVINFLKIVDKKSDDYVELNRYLSTIKKQTHALALYLLDDHGEVVASSDDEDKSAIGYNLSHRPYFQKAEPNKTIGYFGVGISSSISGYYQANGIYINGVKKGVVVTKINLNDHMNNNNNNYYTVLLDRSKIVAYSSNPDWFYHVVNTLSLEDSKKISNEKRYYNAVIQGEDVKWELSLGNRSGIALVNNSHYVYCYNYIPEINMIIAALVPLSQIVWAALPYIVAVNLMLALILILIFTMNQRGQIIKLKLEKQQALEIKKEKLEFIVNQRTNELFKRSKQLEAEIQERMSTEKVLRDTQNELLHKEKLATIGKLSVGLAHEINQPLSAINMLSANALKLIDIGAAEEAKGNLLRVLKSVEFIGQLSNQLRTFSRSKDDSVGPVSVSASLDNAMLLISHLFRQHDCRFNKLSTDGDVWCMCNNIRLEQVFVNILSNALDAVIENQTARIVTAEWAIENNFAVVKIEDNGVGIAEENSGKIFDPFFTTKINRGLGLGLSISADIIQSYNGTLSAENGKAGACFVIRLPLANINEGN